LAIGLAAIVLVAWKLRHGQSTSTSTTHDRQTGQSVAFSDITLTKDQYITVPKFNVKTGGVIQPW
jgi:hypothetical protein